jgi:hypothetical protein
VLAGADDQHARGRRLLDQQPADVGMVELQPPAGLGMDCLPDGNHGLPVRLLDPVVRDR